MGEDNFTEYQTVRLEEFDENTEGRLPNDGLLYGAEDTPPWPTRILMGVQQAMVATSGVIAAPWVVSELVCAASLPLARVYLIGTTLVITGLSTILQTTFGCRLPLLQGPSFMFVPPIIAMKTSPHFNCPWDNVGANLSVEDFTTTQLAEIWMSRMTTIQGALLAASLTQILLGLTGIVGILTKRIGPLTIAPLMLLLELSVVKLILHKMSSHWISLLSLSLLGLFAIYLNRVKVPLPTFENRKFAWTSLPIFGMFPYLMAIVSAWVFAAILTNTNVFNDTTDSPARTDTNLHVLTQAPWIRLPYPGQWGWPSFHLGVFLGFVASTIGSVVESIGDYQACARVCAQKPPPTHAINRGIFMEGLCCAIGACFGGSVSVTTYSENVGVVGITKVASRSIMIVGGVVFILLGIFTKFGALLATMPDPIIVDFATSPPQLVYNRKIAHFTQLVYDRNCLPAAKRNFTIRTRMSRTPSPRKRVTVNNNTPPPKMQKQHSSGDQMITASTFFRLMTNAEKRDSVDSYKKADTTYIAKLLDEEGDIVQLTVHGEDHKNHLIYPGIYTIKNFYPMQQTKSSFLTHECSVTPLKQINACHMTTFAPQPKEVPTTIPVHLPFCTIADIIRTANIQPDRCFTNVIAKVVEANPEICIGPKQTLCTQYCIVVMGIGSDFSTRPDPRRKFSTRDPTRPEADGV